MEKGTSYTHVKEDLRLTICKEIEELWRQRTVCDVNLMVYNSQDSPLLSISAHRLVLAASIPYFKAMFTTGMQESGQNEVILKDVDANSVKSIVGFVYTTKLEITEENAQGLLSTASLFGLPEIVSVCARYISKHLSPVNCLGILKFAQLFNLEDLVSAASKFHLQHFVEMSQNDEFLQLSFEEVEDLVSDEKITINSEEDVYYAVTRWIEADDDRVKYTVPLYSHVRFPIIEANFLNTVVLLNSSLSQVREIKMMIQEALDYHKNPASVLLFSNPKKTQPRSSLMGVICLVGGSGDSGQSMKDVSFFNPHEKKWRSGVKMLQRRSRLALVLFKGELYAIGGTDITEPHGTVEKFSPLSNMWVKVASLNTARRSCSAVVTPLGILVLGGYSGSVYLHSVELYDPQIDEWTYQPAMLEARSDLCTVYFDQRLYAIGGVNSKEELRSVERFDLLNRKWEKMASMYAPRANAGECELHIL